MSNKTILSLIITTAFVISCSRNNPSIDSINGLPVIDVTKNYPEKEIKLTDIADVTYVVLDSKDNNFLYKGGIVYVTENIFVVQDASSGSILFFSKDGFPKSRFNRRGQGPEEYLGISNLIVYDEIADDVFVGGPTYTNYIQVYSSKGDYKRKLILPSSEVVSIRQMDSFDDQSLIVYNEGRRFYKAQPKTTKDNMDYLTHTVDSSYFLISKTDGRVLDYIPMPFSQIDLFIKTSSGGIIGPMLTGMVKHAEGFLLCNQETDTVFLYSKNGNLTPVISKTPINGKLDPKVILNNCMDFDKYQFMEVQTLIYGKLTKEHYKYYIRDKKTGEIYRQKIILPDYKGKTFIISPDFNYFSDEKGTLFSLGLFELKQAYKENRLSGKLKALVATLNEFDDNSVYMFVHFN